MSIKFFVLLFLYISLYGSEVLGRIDKFDFPEFNLENVKVKIDTGAKTSSLHCVSIKNLKNGFVNFIIFDKSNKKFTGEYIKKKINRIAYVKSSNGVRQKRIFIKTPVVVLGQQYTVELSLNFRGEMQYPILIGRELLKQNFIVDVTQKNLSFKSKVVSPQ